MITVRYSETDHACIISNISEENWSDYQIHYSELSSFTKVSDGEIIVPWHLFVSGMIIFRYLIKKNRTKVDIDDTTRNLIKLAIDRKNQIMLNDSSRCIDESEVQERLSRIGFRRTLKEHQIRNVAKLSCYDFAATFSVPGAGKTTEAIAFYSLKKSNNTKLIVISPKSAFPAWEEQFIECLGIGKISIARLTGGRDNIAVQLDANLADVNLISYQQFILVVDLISKSLHQYEYFMFLDESHRIKGGDNSKTGQAIQEISHLPVGKLIMSGTPMPNSVKDLLPQFSFLYPGVNNVDETNVSDFIKPVYVRTTKPELGLKPLNIQRTKIPFTEPQRVLYDLVRSEEYRRVKDLDKSDKFFLRKLGKSYMRLLQIASNPALLINKNLGFSNELRETIEFGDSAKIDYAIFKARELASRGEKVLIWSGFVDNVELLASRLVDVGARFIHGGVEAGSDEDFNTREGIIKEFHESEDCMALVANPAACSEGISLHKVCHHAIYLDRDYNAARYLQSQDRIHRLGLPENVDTQIEILYSPDSIDERVNARLNMKIERMASVLNDDSLNVEVEEVDIEDMGFSSTDAIDFINHLRS